MDYQNLSQSDAKWLALIQQCRASGKTDSQWLKENDIRPSTFYKHIHQLKVMSCDIPKSCKRRKEEINEVVPWIISDTCSTSDFHDSIDDCTAAVRICVNGISVGISKIYCITGRTDMRRGIDGLMAIIRDTYKMDPYANALYLFCGKRRNTLKVLYHDRDGFCLVYKRPDCTGRFQWPRNASEVRPLTRQEFRWLMEGLSIDQPQAIHPVPKSEKRVF